MRAMGRRAGIDMGANPWRVVVYGDEPGGYWQHVDEIRGAVRVSQGMEGTDRIQPEPFERALHTARVFNAFCASSGIDDVVALATSAIRDAENGDELIGAMRAESDFDVDVISGRDEARYGYLAIA